MDLPGFRINDFKLITRVVHEHLIPGFMVNMHGQFRCISPYLKMITELRIAVSFRMLFLILAVQNHQGYTGLLEFLYVTRKFFYKLFIFCISAPLLFKQGQELTIRHFLGLLISKST